MSEVPLYPRSSQRGELQGVPRSQENAPSQDPTVGLCLGSWRGYRGHNPPYPKLLRCDAR